ncbi:MAG: penicillin-binding transpeptidase domain-containing protein [Clostridia bacterium]|nr:penicillin-binding transpeptidase domain-containing protein [Clostridia bacterium]
MARKNGNTEGVRFTVYLILIAVLFSLVTVFYILQLANYQLVNRSSYTSSVERTYKRTVTIVAQRGEIFDRNGNALVTNVYTYNLNFDYGSLSRNAEKSNAVILSAGKALLDTGNGDKRVESNFPLLGTYPNFIYDDSKMSNESYRRKYDRAMKELGFHEDKDGNPIENSAQELSEKLADKFSLLSENEDGEPLYTSEEITELMRVRFDMAFVQFSSAQPYTFAKDVDLTFITYIEENNPRGLTFTKEASRKYEYPGYASHLLGRVGQIQKDDLEYYTEKGYKMNAIVGVDGCEKAFEEFLRGTDGVLEIVEDGDGNVISKRVTKEPVIGNDVWLTLDIEMQIAAEDGLRDNIAYIVDKAKNTKGELDGEDASAGAAAAVSVTGEVLALASYPTFDLSLWSTDYNTWLSDESKPMLNRALMGQYQPGSTFKVGVAVAALEEGIITPRTTITDKGRYTYYDPNGPRCWIYLQSGRTHGTINVVEAIQHSCNYFFYDVGRQLTITKLNDYCHAYGLGLPTGIELPESTGVLAGPDYRAEVGREEWYPGDTLQASIGQSDNLFTPLQISCYTATLVGGGVRYSAHLLGSVRNFYTNEIIYEYAPKELGNVEMSDTTHRTILNAMKSVTENGSASRVFRSYPIGMGGKTGTAQVSKKKSDNAIFTAFAPFDDPQIVASVVIEQGNNGTDAGYTVKDIFDCYFGLGDYAPEEE